MTTFVKNFIGKGTQVNSLDIVKVVITVDEAMKATFEKNGITYISFEVAKMKDPDKFGRTHTCYFQTKVKEDQPAESESQKLADKKKSKKHEHA